VKIDQIQTEYDIYDFPLDIEILFKDGTTECRTMRINKRQNKFNFEFGKEPAELTADPDNWLPARIQMIKNGSE
jgi:hypothetical protein